MVHDSEQSSCPDRSHVMSRNPGRGMQLYEWSKCSALQLKAYRLAGRTKCLTETDPANLLIQPSCFDQQYTLTYQCKAMYGDHATVCPIRPWYNNSVSARMHFMCCMSAMQYELSQFSLIYVHTISLCCLVFHVRLCVFSVVQASL